MTTPEAEPERTPAQRLTDAIAAARETLPATAEAVRAIDAGLREYEPFIEDFGSTAQEGRDDPGAAIGVAPAYTRFIGSGLESLETGFDKAGERLAEGTGAVRDARRALAELKQSPQAWREPGDLKQLERRVEQLGDAYDGATALVADARRRMGLSRGRLEGKPGQEWTAARVEDVRIRVDNDVQAARAELTHTGNEMTTARANAGVAGRQSEQLAKWLQTAPPGSGPANDTEAGERDLRHRQGPVQNQPGRGPRE